MKKIPLVLSGLVLTTSNINLTTAVLASDQENQGQTTGVMEETLDSLTPRTMLLSGGTTIRSDHATLNPYEHQDQISFTRIDPTADKVTFELYGLNKGWKPQKIVIVQRDYENGVTEAEADRKFVNLTDAETDWGVDLITNTFTRPATSNTYATTSGHKLADNKTDIIYYAIQFAEETVGDSGESQLSNAYWLRGKIDYRHCVHSSVYDSATMACYLMTNDDARTANYQPIKSGILITMPENEVVMTWDEEWRMILFQRVDEIRQKLQLLKDDLTTAESVLVQSGVSIEQMDKVADTSRDAEQLRMELNYLRTLLSETQAVYDSLGEGSSEADKGLIIQLEQKVRELEVKLTDAEAKLAEMKAKMAEMEAEYQDLEVVNQGMAAKIATLEQEKAGLEQEKTGLTQENQELKQAKADLTEENQELGQANASLNQKNQELERRIADLERELADKNQPDQVETDDTKQDSAPDASGGSQTGEKVESAVVEPDSGTTAQSPSKTPQGANNGNQNEVAVAPVTMNTVQSNQVRVLEDNSVEEGVAPETETAEKDSTLDEKNEREVSNAEVEVPNLGGTETKFNFWWAIAGVIGAVGAAAIWVRKKFSSRS